MDNYDVFELPALVKAETLLAMAAALTHATRQSRRDGV
jgi:hypothetical protein